MAELAVLNIAKSLLQQLGSPAKDELKLWFNSDAEVEKLKNTITCIKGVVHDAGQRKASNKDIGAWLSRLQDVMYEADDLFDTISTRALKRKVISGNQFKKEVIIFFSKSNQVAFIVKTAHKVKELREQLDDIAKDISQFGLIRSVIDNDQRHQGITMKRKAQHSFVMEHEVIGREEDKQKLLRLLTADPSVKERVSVIAVVGIGGQGKTTIAQLLYNLEEVVEFFEVRLWACINDFSDLKDVLEEITGTKSHSLDELQNRLRDKINGKKFLLVIDDVWDDIREHWLDLSSLLYVGENGSKVLMTTRSQMVAHNLATLRPYYALGELTDEHAWVFFKKMAFDNNGGEDDHTKEELGKKILKKCPKVPLAIRTIGSFLYGKDKKQWSALIDHDLMKVMPDKQNTIMQVLKISYDDLPSSLKHCFVYCSLFAKDNVFNKSTLIHLWMSQGFLGLSGENRCLEEVGEDYFLYLVQRGFFQNVDVDEYGEILNCKMHDLFHDLAVQVVANECQTMLKATDELEGKVPRHLLVMNINESLIKCKGLRSMISPNTSIVERRLLDGVLLNLTSLRTLSLRKLETKEIPSSISKLAHLRYLDLRDSKNLIHLPSSLCKVQTLEILRLEGCQNLIKLPNGLCKLISLRSLTIKGCDTLERMPLGMEKLSSLVTLDRLIVHKDSGGLRCLKHLDNLAGVLCIELPRGGWKNRVDDAEQCRLSRKKKLSRLSLSWSWTMEGAENFEIDTVLCWLQPSDNISHLAFEGFHGVKFPNWLSSLHNLVELRIENCCVCFELPQLKPLLHLKRLSLANILLLDYVENYACCDNGPFFPSLEHLEMSCMSRLKGWWRPEGEIFCKDLCFLRLSYLRVWRCPELASLPLCPFVVDLDLIGVSENLVMQVVRLPKPIELEAYHSSLGSTSNNNHTSTCSKLIKVSLSDIHDLRFLPKGFNNMPFLKTLSVNGSPSLKQSSLFFLFQNMPSLENLFLSKFDVTECLVGDFDNMGINSIQWSTMAKLKRLSFDLTKDPLVRQLLKEFHQLIGLEELSIRVHEGAGDEDNQCTSPPNLKQLIIYSMKRVDSLNMFTHLKNLGTLIFFYYKSDEHELNKLPWENLKGLRSFSFGSCPSMKSLPERCQHLIALEEMILKRCSEITSLPDWVSRLKFLEIAICPKLAEACKEPTGSCWPIIRDIPRLEIEGRVREGGSWQEGFTT